MNEPFILVIQHKDETLELPAAFQRYGYTHRIAVSIDDVAYIFEPDEEGSYRVLNMSAGQALPDTVLLLTVAEKLQKL